MDTIMYIIIAAICLIITAFVVTSDWECADDEVIEWLLIVASLVWPIGIPVVLFLLMWHFLKLLCELLWDFADDLITSRNNRRFEAAKHQYNTLKQEEPTMNKKGFTIVEVLIVLVIIGILAAIAIPQFSAYRQRQARTASTTVISPYGEKVQTSVSLTADTAVLHPGDILMYKAGNSAWKEATIVEAAAGQVVIKYNP